MLLGENAKRQALYMNEVLKLIIPEDLSDHTDRQHNFHSPPQRDPAPAYKAVGCRLYWLKTIQYKVSTECLHPWQLDIFSLLFSY